MKGIEVFPKYKKKKSINIVAIDVKIFSKIKNKGCLSTEKSCFKMWKNISQDSVNV